MLKNAKANLYIMATPIGNLEDITYRAVRILGEVDVIAAEDTRQSRKLLTHYNITPKMLISCRAHNERNSALGIVKLLDQGKSVAYVSDAGTPCISDPGGKLVSCVRTAGFNVIPIPGASAVTTIMSVAGIAGKGFVFEGFLSPKKARRQKRLRELLEMATVFILYESPHRLISLLNDLVLLAPGHQIVIGREITKKFEQIICCKINDVLQFVQEGYIIKGELTIVVSKA